MCETEAAFKLSAEFFFNDRGKEIDFIAGANRQVGVEVKIRKRVDYQDAKWLVKSTLPLKRRVLLVGWDSQAEKIKGVEISRISEIDSLAEGLEGKKQ